jgi:hypothetical protein
MESRWYIPPFRGKINKNTDSEVEYKNKLEKIEAEDMKSRIKQLENIITEHDQEHIIGMEVLIKEQNELCKELNEIKLKMAIKHRYDAIIEKIEAQKLETQEIKEDINEAKSELENLTHYEENLYFEIHEKKVKIKEINEEILRSSKESQLNSSHYKLIYKDLQEKNESLLLLNRYESLKNEILKDFTEKLNKKKGKENFKLSAHESEYRVLKIQIESIDKDISEIMVSLLNHSNSIISQTFDYTETSY